MWAAECRTEAHEVHVGIDAANDAAFQSGMTHFHLRFLAQDIAIHLHHLGHDGAVEVGLPSTIMTTVLYLHASHREAALLHLLDVLHHRLVARAGKDQDAGLAITDGHDAQVRAGLHYGRDAGDVPQHTIVTSHDGIDQVVLYLFRNATCWHSGRLHGQRDAFFHSTELVVEDILTVLSQFAEVIVVLQRYGHHDACCSGNGIAHVATLPRAETCLVVGNGLTHKASHQLVGIAAALVNLQAAMTATQALQRHLHCNVAFLQLHLFVLHRSVDVHTTSRANHELAHRLIVDVQEDVALQRISSEVVHTIHAGLFVSRDEGFQRTVLDVVALHDGHDGSHANAVVTAQRRTLRLHPVPVDVGLYGVCLEVMVALVHLLRHHIHVSLQHSRLSILATRSGRLTHHDVLSPVLEGLDAMFLCPVEQELLHPCQVTAWAWHLSQEIKILPNDLRIKVLDNCCHSLYSFIISIVFAQLQSKNTK